MANRSVRRRKLPWDSQRHIAEQRVLPGPERRCVLAAEQEYLRKRSTQCPTACKRPSVLEKRVEAHLFYAPSPRLKHACFGSKPTVWHEGPSTARHCSTTLPNNEACLHVQKGTPSAKSSAEKVQTVQGLSRNTGGECSEMHHVAGGAGPASRSPGSQRELHIANTSQKRAKWAGRSHHCPNHSFQLRKAILEGLQANVKRRRARRCRSWLMCRGSRRCRQNPCDLRQGRLRHRAQQRTGSMWQPSQIARQAQASQCLQIGFTALLDHAPAQPGKSM